MNGFFISIPHSGEQIPDEVAWLKGLPEEVLMCDVDRYVDRLYLPVIQELHIPAVLATFHRWVVDLNRWSTDVDADSVEGSSNPSGAFPKGLHWSVSTLGHKILPQPLSPEVHKRLVELYFEPFHEQMRSMFRKFHENGAEIVYHIDAHSMPSVGTKAHRDPGQKRAGIVVSDVNGTSCAADFKDLVIEAYQKSGFEVAYNWPYIGGRVTETYGKPSLGNHSIQVELNRALYMNEVTKKLEVTKAQEVSEQIKTAICYIHKALQ